MKNFLFLFSIIMTTNLMAESRLSVDVTIDKLQFQKPTKGVGKAGLLIFKSANVNNNGIVLNINNTNNYFDSQIFVRPTFLGFTTQFGNYGFPIEKDNIINTLEKTELQKSKLILDDTQLNLSGEFFNFITPDKSLKLKNFRLYCQNLTNASALDQSAQTTSEAPSMDIMKSCLNFLTLNGSYASNNQLANLEFERVDLKTGDKTFAQAAVTSFDLRSTQINAQLSNLKTVSNNSYSISANQLNLNCAKDADLKDLDFDKLKKTCLNQLKINPLKANLEDKSAKSMFNLDIKDVTVKDKIVYFTLNNAALSDATSTTYLTNLLLNCRKETETDLLDLNQVINDCISYSRLSLAEVKSTKPDQKNDTSIRNISVSSTNNALIIQADVKFIGVTARVSIQGIVALNQAGKQLIITVTDTKLPLGINSVKLLMYFLKKNLISKDISITNNVITIGL